MEYLLIITVIMVLVFLSFHYYYNNYLSYFITKLASNNIFFLFKRQISAVKTNIYLNSAGSFVNNCPHFPAIMYNKFQQSYNNKETRIKLLIQFVTMVRLNWYSQTEL